MGGSGRDEMNGVGRDERVGVKGREGWGEGTRGLGVAGTIYI